MRGTEPKWGRDIILGAAEAGFLRDARVSPAVAGRLAVDAAVVLSPTGLVLGLGAVLGAVLVRSTRLEGDFVGELFTLGAPPRTELFTGEALARLRGVWLMISC